MTRSSSAFLWDRLWRGSSDQRGGGEAAVSRPSRYLGEISYLDHIALFDECLKCLKKGMVFGWSPRAVRQAFLACHCYANLNLLYRVTVDMRQHCRDGSFRFYRWRAHTETLSEDSGPEALSTQGQYFALQVFYEILEHIAGELSANCCRTITMTRYSFSFFPYECLLRL